MYSSEIRDISDYTRQHILSPEISIRIIKVTDDIMLKMAIPYQLRKETMRIIVSEIVNESLNLLEQEGIR